CVTRMLRVEGADNTFDVLLRVARKVGIGVILPENMHGVCCGQLFSSKGFAAAYQYTADKMLALLWELSQEGRLPVVMDGSSCTYTMLNDRKRFESLQILDVVDF